MTFHFAFFPQKMNYYVERLHFMNKFVYYHFVVVATHELAK